MTMSLSVTGPGCTTPPYEQGKNAAAAGMPKCLNPFEPRGRREGDPVKAKEWDRGYDEL